MILEALTFIGIFIAIFFFLGLCILIHELGHLLCALWRGLHVERFSIGFGRKLWGFKRNGVEYRISLLPFGGYVALPQLEPGNEPKTEEGEPLPLAKPTDRMLAAFSGPLFNVLLGFALGSIIWLAGIERPLQMDELEVYQVEEESPEYEAGLRPGDRIFEVNGKPAESFDNLVRTTILATGEVKLSLRRNAETMHVSYLPKPNPDPGLQDFQGLAYPFFEVKTPVAIQEVLPQSPAEEAGLQGGDRILAVNQQPVHNSLGFIQTIDASAGEPMSITVQRDGQTIEFTNVRPRHRQKENEDRYVIGVQLRRPMETHYPTPWRQFKNVLTMTRDTLAAIISPESTVGPRHVSGPVGIMQIQYTAFRHHGWRQGLSIVILITFSLALINLLPIPVLDGGHIVVAGVELATGRRMPERLAWFIQVLFFLLLIGFMLYVTLYDIGRLRDSLQPSPNNQETAPAEESEFIAP